ncbi:hypothetical protein M0R45_006478 [Rubus argutus]|uniref:Uncharacterized protein n=1 Tax=Rubus argutus TaxID=59490 RepID=A0AAW1YQQ5_RUBAR
MAPCHHNRKLLPIFNSSPPPHGLSTTNHRSFTISKSTTANPCLSQYPFQSSKPVPPQPSLLHSLTCQNKTAASSAQGITMAPRAQLGFRFHRHQTRARVRIHDRRRPACAQAALSVDRSSSAAPSLQPTRSSIAPSAPLPHRAVLLCPARAAAIIQATLSCAMPLYRHRSAQTNPPPFALL